MKDLETLIKGFLQKQFKILTEADKKYHITSGALPGREETGAARNLLSLKKKFIESRSQAVITVGKLYINDRLYHFPFVYAILPTGKMQKALANIFDNLKNI